MTFHAKKPAHVLEPGRSRCGEVVVADIGLAPTPSQTVENGPELWLPRFPWPTRGLAQARARPAGGGQRRGLEHGRGAAGGARRACGSGAGLVTVLSPPEALAVNAAHLEAVMLRGVRDRPGAGAGGQATWTPR